MTAGPRPKPGGGWFPAGEAFERALGVLSDGAFKVFAHVCLHAERASGRLEFRRAALARRLGKSRSALGRHLRELVAQGVCRLEAAPNQHRGSRLQVRAAYWPCERAASAAPAEGAGAYVASVRRLFERPRCVQGPFSAADERLAASWHREGLPLEAVRRAILLGCTRKSMSLVDRPEGQPIRSLAYFEPVLSEVREGAIPASCWQHLEFTLARCERHWRAATATQAGRARPDLEQAAAPGATSGTAACVEERKERRDDDDQSPR